ncbi:MAG: TetR/AcrR family transcriptional regulator [Myxococcota bacterium]
MSATRTVILRDGFGNLTVDAVAEVADVSKPAVYYYFDSKESLARALLVQLAHEEVDAVTAAVEATPVGGSVVAAAVRAYVAHHLDAFELFRAMAVLPLVLEAPPEGYPEVDARMMGLFDLLESRIAADAAAGRIHEGVHPRRAGITTWSSMQGLVSMLALLESVNTGFLHTVDAMVDELCGTLTRGIYR